MDLDIEVAQVVFVGNGADTGYTAAIDARLSWGPTLLMRRAN